MADYKMFPPEVWQKLIAKLAALDEQLKANDPNKNTRVMILIAEAIGKGITKEASIIAAIRDTGHNPRHIGKILKDNCGEDPAQHCWAFLADKTYSLHA